MFAYQAFNHQTANGEKSKTEEKNINRRRITVIAEER